jgi:hypothetical protein
MGMVLPMQEDLLLTPNERSMIGYIDNDVPVMREVRRIDIPGTLAVCGIINRGAQPKARPFRAGASTRASTSPGPEGPGFASASTAPTEPMVEQRFAVIALPDGRAIYVDALSLKTEAKPKSIRLGTLGILNDKNWVYHNSRRTVRYQDGERTFVAADAATEAPLQFHSHWLNIDDCLGVGVLTDSPSESYDPKPTRAAGRLEQILTLNNVSTEHVDGAHTAVVFYAGQTSQQTSQAAAKCSFHAENDGQITITLDDGRVVQIDLSQLKISL